MFWKKYRYEIYGILFTSLSGTLLHFIYEWSGSLAAVGLFAPVNESVWEHIKLLFFPGLLFSVWEYFHASRRPASFLPARTAGLSAGMAAIPLLFYAYTALLGTNHLALDITVFLLGILLAFLISALLEKKISAAATTASGTKAGILPFLCAALLVLYLLLFFLFTFRPPQLPLFQDPVSGHFGIS
ncbi:DUF6512 family protein [Eisenbergiella sp.]